MEQLKDRVGSLVLIGPAGTFHPMPCPGSPSFTGTGANRVFPRVYSTEEFGRVEAPTLLLIGDREKIYSPIAAVEAAARLLPGIETGLVPDAHHIAAISQPQIVNERILEHLAKHVL